MDGVSIAPMLQKFIFFTLISIVLSGCGAIQSYRFTQIMNDEQKLTRLYTECIEEHYGKPDEVKQYCEPIVAPLRIRGLEK